MRERWAILTNEALRAANLDARVDHRSLAAQGIDREPTPAIPLMHLKMEQQGVRSEFAERLRADYRARVEQRAARAASQEANAALAPAQPEDLEQVRRQAREAWLQLRARETVASVPGHGARETEAEAVRKEAEDDLTL